MKLTVKTVALSGVALGMFVTVANAADAVVTASDWTGFNIGIGGGGSFNFANVDAGGVGAFSVAGDSGWMDGNYIFGSGGSSNYGYTSTDDDESGGNTQMWAAAGMGNVSSLIAEILSGYGAHVEGNGNGGDNDAGKAGFIGTVRGGFDYQLDRVVLGLDAAFNFGKTEINNSASGVAGGEYNLCDDCSPSGSYADGFGDGEAYLTSSLELGNSWSIGARAGFLATESTLIFGSAGYVSTHAKLSAAFNGRNDAGTEGTNRAVGSGYADAQYDISSSSSDWLDGYYIGAGIEQLMTDSVSLKLEYRFADLGSIQTSDSLSLEDSNISGGATWDAAVAAQAEPTVHTIMATINWRF